MGITSGGLLVWNRNLYDSYCGSMPPECYADDLETGEDAELWTDEKDTLRTTNNTVFVARWTTTALAGGALVGGLFVGQF